MSRPKATRRKARQAKGPAPPPPPLTLVNATAPVSDEEVSLLFALLLSIAKRRSPA